MRNKKGTITSVIGAVVSLLGVIIASYMQFASRNVPDDSQLRLIDVAYSMRLSVIEIDQRTTALEQLLKQIQQDSRNSALPVAIGLREQNERLKRVEESSLALRQALNPLDPEKVLSVARLQDAVSATAKKLDEGLVDLRRDQDAFKAAVIRELDRGDKTTTLILFTLAPLVLNLLYGIAKDARAARKGDGRGADAPPAAG